MQQMSVNIANHERGKIKEEATKRFLKTAQNRHPDPDFIKNLTKKIFYASLEYLRPLINSGDIKYVQHVPITKISPVIAAHVFPPGHKPQELVDGAANLRNGFIHQRHLLESIEKEDFIIPSEFIHVNASGGDMVPMCLKTYGYAEGYSPSQEVELSHKLEEEIAEFNELMTSTYSDMNTQLRTLLETIEQCKSTKMFELKLPQLVSLYPKSVKDKLEKKNTPVDRELTNEEQMLANATNSIAAAALFDDED